MSEDRKEPAAVGVLRSCEGLSKIALTPSVVGQIVGYIDAQNERISLLESQLEAAESLMEFNDD